MNKLKTAGRIFRDQGFVFLVRFTTSWILGSKHQPPRFEEAWKTYPATLCKLETDKQKDDNKREYVLIIPIYNGFEHVKILLSNLIDFPEEIILIDDGSTDVQLKQFLQLWASSRGAKLIINKENLGYIKSVNLAIETSDLDFILLNSDTEVAGDWSERLINRLYLDDETAVVTPFSNAATIYSFPQQNQDNLVDFRVNDLQKASSVNTKFPNFDAPTANGFCMAIRRTAWNEIGNFDEIKFGMGYGEECDWSMRAKTAGWKVALAPDVFVKHLHGGSFESTTKSSLLRSSALQLREDWPSYFVDVQRHVENDPWSFLRARIKLSLLLGNNWTIIFKTNLPGGAHKWYTERAIKEISRGHNVLEVYQNEFGQVIGKPFAPKDLKNSEESFEFRDWIELKEFFQETSSNKQVIFSSLVGYQDPVSVVNLFGSKGGFDSILPVHDFFSICPSHNLLDKENKFCNVPSDLEICKKCLPNNLNVISTYRNVDVEIWRNLWLENINSIEYFSNSSIEIFQKLGFNFGSSSLSKHKEFSNTEKSVAISLLSRRKEVIRKKIALDEKLNIAFVGAFSKNKGSEVFNSLQQLALKSELNWDFFVIGRIHNKPNKGIRHFSYFGLEQLIDILEANGIDLCVIPAIWPETYNYVLDELMSMGFNVVVSPIGAPPERLILDETEFGIASEGISAHDFLEAVKVKFLEIRNDK